MVTIATFNEPAKAKHLKDRLQEAGLKADIHNEGHLQQVAFMSKPQANAKVMVDEDDFETAQQLMVEWESTDPDIGSAIRCPQCSLPRIEYPQLTRKFLTPALASVLFALRIFPERILLPGLPLHLEQRRRPLPRYRFWNRFFSGPRWNRKGTRLRSPLSKTTADPRAPVPAHSMKPNHRSLSLS